MLRFNRVFSTVHAHVQRRVLHEDRAFDPLELYPRLEPELVHQTPSRLAIHLEPFRLPAGPIQREHELLAEALAKRMLDRKRLQLGDQRQLTAERELGIDPFLYRRQPQLLQPFHVDPRERLELDVRQRPAAPDRFGGTERLSGARSITGGERLVPLHDKPLEPLEVELPRLDPQEVAGSARHQSWRIHRNRPEHLPQPGNVVAERMVGRVDALADEQFLDQILAWDDAVRAQQKKRQERTLLWTADWDRHAVHANRERTQDPELKTRRHRSPGVSLSRSTSTTGRDRFGTALGHRLADDRSSSKEDSCEL